MEIITRAQWGARHPKTTPVPITTPTPEFWLHHAAGAILAGDDDASPADYRRIRSIQNYHMDVRNWNDIAYSWLMDPDGNVFEGRGPGVRGGHTAGHNTVSHALCIMGNYDIQAVDSDLVPRIVEFARYTFEQGWTPLTFTGGHRDVSLTSCPGNNLYPLIPEINERIVDVATPQEIAQAVWAHQVQSGITAALALDRNYRNINELIIAHRTSTLGTTAIVELDDEDLQAIADAVADEQARRLSQ